MNTSEQDTTSEGKSSDELKREIDHTRSRMDDTIDELSQKVNPGKLWDTVLDTFKSSSASTGGSNSLLKSLAEPIKQNPAAAIALGASAVWFIASMSSDDDEREYDYDYEGDDDVARRRNHYGNRVSRGSSQSGLSSAQGGKSGAIDTAKDKLSNVAETASEKFGDLKHTVSSMASDAKETVSSFAGDAKDSASSFASDARESIEQRRREAAIRGERFQNRSKRAYRGATDKVSDLTATTQERYNEALSNNPLGLLVGAIGIGLAAGAATPLTRRENELFGEQSDEFTDKIKSVGADLLEKGKNVGEKVATQALDEVESSNVGGVLKKAVGDIKEEVSSAAENVGEEAEKAAKDEGLHPDRLSEDTKDS